MTNFLNELILWSNQNFNWVRLPKSFCTGSSMMPNKLNPDLLELLRCDFKSFFAAPTELMAQLSSLPSGYSRDLQVIKDQLLSRTQNFGELLNLFSEFLQELEFNEKSIECSLEKGVLDATLAMEELVLKGVPMREAHGQLAKNVQGQLKGKVLDECCLLQLNRYKSFGSAGE